MLTAAGTTGESSGAIPNIGIPSLYDFNYGALSRDIRHNRNYMDPGKSIRQRENTGSKAFPRESRGRMAAERSGEPLHAPALYASRRQHLAERPGVNSAATV